MTLSSVQPLLDVATDHHRAGNLLEARRCYAEVLRLEPANTVALFRSGLLELQDLRLDAALLLISRAASASPQDERYQLGLGRVFHALGRWVEAAEACRRALIVAPESADAHFALGLALQSQTNHDSAIASFERAIDFRPNFPEALNNLGMSRQLTRHHAQAAAAYRAALTLRPGDTTFLGNLGAVLRELGDVDESVAVLRAANGLDPNNHILLINLAISLCQRRDFADAEALLRKAIALDADNAGVAFNLAIALDGLGRGEEAVQLYQRAVEISPGYADAWNNLGIAYQQMGDFPSARNAFGAAIEVRPQFVVAINNLGCLLRMLGRIDEAEQVLRQGLEIDPRHAALHDNLGSVLKDSGQLDEGIDCFRKALELDPLRASTHSNLAYALSFQSFDATPILEVCATWNERLALPLLPPSDERLRASTCGRRLKIGYVSADFRDHCQTLFTLPLLSHHDRSQFEVFCYSSVQRPDEHTRLLATHVEVWRDVRSVSDAELSEKIRNDGIDILVDLTMHMANNRLLVFARKPAPVQMTWLAYPGTTGLAAMDWRLSDPRLDPEGFDTQYTERTLRLADSFWCYDPLTSQPQVGPLPAATRGHLTLGCLNNPCKLTDRTFRLWGGVMSALPDAQLLLMAPAGRYRQRLLQRLKAENIDSERVEFVGFRPRAEYLASYHDIDLGLDTFPYNGHTTSLDALWMGVPTISRVGTTSVGRGGLSQLFHLDLLDLVAYSDEAFIETAVALGTDLPRLSALRRDLRARLERSPLMDGQGFARNIQSAYVQAWTSQ